MDEVRVLVVDDHEPFRRALAAMLRETDGFVLVGAVASGEDAVARTPALRPDLVLMDVHLPGISGIEATRRIRTRPGAPAVLLLSTYAEDEVDHAGSGAAAYLGKAELDPGRLREAWLTAGAAG